MIRIFKLVLLLVVSQVAFGQAPSNYTNINGRYRWIAGMFDSTFHIPKGTSPSLRTGGSTNAGGLFYNTSDSSVYTYTGTQWIKARGSINPSDTTNKYVTQVYKKNGSDSVFYVKGGNHLFAFVDSVGSPGGGGGGKIYYFNGGVNMGTIGGLQMYELGDTANTGAAANFTRATTGNIANFITDPGKPGLVQIPAGVWSVDAWLSETGGGANHAEIWIEVEKWDGSTITTIATSPIEQITEGSTPNLYSWSVSIPTTSLTVTDRIIIQFYISNTNGKTVTLYTQNGYVGEVHTTFTTGIGAINGLTAPAQYLVTGTSGTDFNINSVTATHTFNLPTASATNRGALSSTDWTTFNSKIGGSGTTNYVSKFTGSGTIGNSQIFDNATSVGIGTAFPSASYKLDVNGNINVSNAVNYSQGGTKYGWTYATVGAMAMEGLQGADISLGTGSGAVATERMVIKNSGNVGIGITPDSMFTVAQGTHLQRGVRMSGLPSAVGTKSLRIDASGTLSVVDTGLYVPTSRTITINGTTQDLTADRTWNVGTVTTAAATGGGQVAFFNGSTVLTSISTLYFDGVNKLAIGNSSPDSMLSVTQGAHIQRGVRLSGLPSAPGTRALRVDANGTLSVSDTLTNGISGSGTTNYIPKFTSSSAIGNSIISESGGVITVNGGITMNGTMTIQSSGIVRGYFGDVDGDNNVQLRSQAALTFKTGGNNLRATLDASGNLGLAVTPSAWSVIQAMQVLNTSWGASPNNLISYQSSNVFFDGAFKYITNGTATQYRMNDSGVFSWFIAPSGTAGNAITFTQAMTLFSTGNLAVGGTSDGGFRLEVTGEGRFYQSATNSAAYLRVENNRSRNAAVRLTTTLGDYYIGTGIGADVNQFQIYDGNAGVNRLTIASTGAATFSSSVTANGNSVVIRGSGTNNTVISSGTLWGDTAPIISVYNSSTTTNTGAGFQMQVGGGSAIAGILGIAESTSQAALGFYTGGSGTVAEKMRITSGGGVGINTQTPNATFHVNGSIASAISIKTATYTLTSSDYTVVFDLNGNATANLPNATTCSGRIYVIKINRTNVSDVLTIDPNGAQTIDGNATYDLQCQQAITIQSDGSNWRIIGDYAAGVNCL